MCMPSSRAGGVAAVPLESLADRLRLERLHICRRLPADRATGRFRRDLPRQLLELDLPVAQEHERVFERCVQLPHVTGVRVRHKHAPRVRAHASHALALNRIEERDEPVDPERDVLDPAPQRRQIGLDDVDAMRSRRNAPRSTTAATSRFVATTIRASAASDRVPPSGSYRSQVPERLGTTHHRSPLVSQESERDADGNALPLRIHDECRPVDDRLARLDCVSQSALALARAGPKHLGTAVADGVLRRSPRDLLRGPVERTRRANLARPRCSPRSRR